MTRLTCALAAILVALVFVRVGVIRGNLLIGGRGLPPIRGAPVRPFHRARLLHGLNTIIFGFAGDRIGGFYMVAGLRITYRYHGQTYVTNAWSASTICVVRNWRAAPENSPACNRASQIDRRATEHLAGV